jgi:predicted nucleic acid-binding protein
MIADSTFLIHLSAEVRAGRRGPALTFFAQRRTAALRTCIVCLAEVAVGFDTWGDAWEFFKVWRIYPLHRGIAEAASDVDRELLATGRRLGENDNWIAGFCRYYREPVISQDAAFDRVRGLRRIAY